MSMEQVRKIAREREALQERASKILWTQFTTGIDLGVDSSQSLVNEFMQNKLNYAVIAKTLQTDLSGEERRRVELIYRKFKNHHLSDTANRLRTEIHALETKLSDIQNKYRIEYLGREITTVEWSQILSKHESRETRKTAYLSRRGINKGLVDAGFLQLIELRKEFAHACGDKDFVSHRLADDELTPDIFDSWKSECRTRKKAFEDRRDQLAQTCLGVEKLMPWDFEFLKNKLCSYNSAQVDMSDFLKPITKTFGAFGFDISKLNLTFDVFPRKNKSEWGYNFTIETGRDSRILANVDNRFSSYWVLLHETAHGVHFLGLDPDDHLMNLGVSGIVAEGFANFFGDLAYSKEFLCEIFPGDTESMVAAFSRVKHLQRLRATQEVALTVFDHELYRRELRSLTDINALRWEVDRDLLGREPYADEPLWGFLIHHTSAPIYLHNYFLGDVMCENMKAVFQRRAGASSVDRPCEFGKFWKEKVLAPSGRFPFLDLYDRICEEKLSIAPYLDRCLAE